MSSLLFIKIIGDIP